MRVSELKGVELDYWVARAEGHDVEREPNGTITAYGVSHDWIECWEPSSDWSQGGPIIDRDGICISWTGAGVYGWIAFSEWTPDWHECRFYWGAKPLVAAMRAFVASKYGETVPDQEAA